VLQAQQLDDAGEQTVIYFAGSIPAGQLFADIWGASALSQPQKMGLVDLVLALWVEAGTRHNCDG